MGEASGWYSRCHEVKTCTCSECVQQAPEHRETPPCLHGRRRVREQQQRGVAGVAAAQRGASMFDMVEVEIDDDGLIRATVGPGEVVEETGAERVYARVT